MLIGSKATDNGGSMRQVIEVSIFLASPGDVAKEREEARNWVEYADRIVGSQHGIRIALVGWETHSRPGVGAYGQDVINSQIGDMSQYDLFVGILGNRYGQPTPVAGSGTEEEFERAMESRQRTGRPDIWLYFSQAPLASTTDEELDQKKKVNQFRKRAQSRGCLTRDYEAADKFGPLFFQQLYGWISTLQKTAPQGPSPPSQAGMPPDDLPLTAPDAHQRLTVPLPYQMQAIEQVLNTLKRDGHQRVHLAEVNRLLQVPLLRDGINPMYEPLTLASVQKALGELMQQGRVRVEENDLVILE